MIEKIISGGQTGADQGALDAAIKLGIPHGGWIPKGRITENGPLPDRYDLIEMPTASYPERTEKNIRESDGTLILSHGRLTGGSEYTKKWALKHGKPMLHIDLSNDTSCPSQQLDRGLRHKDNERCRTKGKQRLQNLPINTGYN
jgi:putative molybdenum carrier protein